MILALLLLSVTATAPDTDPPIIEDLAAAASNPDAPPIVSVTLSDPGSGVGTAYVHYRGVGSTAWDKAELKGAANGLFIARLPDGLQKSGFDYYVEATDVAGNGPTRIGSENAPIRVERATEATKVTLEREAAKHVEPGPQIHPAWLMLSLGVGVLAGGGAGAYSLDLIGTNKKIDDANEKLANPNISDASKAALEKSRSNLQIASTQDTVIAGILGVVGAAGIVTGTTLVVITSLE
jgi:hypothetical protein